MERCSVWRELRIGVGTVADYRGLAGWHYCGGAVVAATRVIAARHGGRVAGVLVERYPVLNCAARNVALPGRYAGADKRAAAEKLNAEMRTIARVVVHPAYRGIGVGEALVREALATATTRYVEALAAMGRVHPLFVRAGMREYELPGGRLEEELVAALERGGMRALDLADAGRVRRTEEVERAMRRLLRRGGGDWGKLVALARQRIVGRPGYYLWGQ